MKKITEFSEISPLVLKYYKRGVITNNYLTPDDYKAEIKEGRLYFEECDQNLWIYVKRDGFYHLYFYILNSEAELPKSEDKLIAELPEKLMEFGEELGFVKLLDRISLKREAQESEFEEIQKASEDDAKRVMEILKSSFDEKCGDLPNLSKISDECRDGLIMVTKTDGKISGVLRFETGKTSAKIKHLAVDAKFRGMGLSKTLVGGFLASQNGKNISVWTGKDNIPAINLYKSFGFSEDKNKSAVYMKG